MKIVNLFGDIVEERQKIKRATLFDDYDGFVDKFMPKLTTDDCYTPKEVYSAILEWIGENYDLAGKTICRPFFPNGDYENEIYKEDDVVIDNPPFSLLATIVDFYDKKGVEFFLFAPELTALVRNPNVCNIYMGKGITYHNGAKVATSFISNLWDDLGIWLAPELGEMIKKAQKYYREHYYNKLFFVDIDNYNMDTMKVVARKLSRQGVNYYIYDTFKAGNMNDSNARGQLIEASKMLHQLAKKYNISITIVMQCAIYLENVRYVNSNCLAEAKAVKEIVTQMVLFRKIFPDEFYGEKYDGQR